MSVLEGIQGCVCYAYFVAKLSYKRETFNKLEATCDIFHKKCTFSFVYKFDAIV